MVSLYGIPDELWLRHHDRFMFDFIGDTWPFRERQKLTRLTHGGYSICFFRERGIGILYRGVQTRSEET